MRKMLIKKDHTGGPVFPEPSLQLPLSLSVSVPVSDILQLFSPRLVPPINALDALDESDTSTIKLIGETPNKSSAMSSIQDPSGRYRGSNYDPYHHLKPRDRQQNDRRSNGRRDDRRLSDELPPAEFGSGADLARRISGNPIGNEDRSRRGNGHDPRDRGGRDRFRDLDRVRERDRIPLDERMYGDYNHNDRHSDHTDRPSRPLASRISRPVDVLAHPAAYAHPEGPERQYMNSIQDKEPGEIGSSPIIEKADVQLSNPGHSPLEASKIHPSRLSLVPGGTATQWTDMNAQVDRGATPIVNQGDTAVPSTPAEQKKTEDEIQSAPVALSPLDDLAKLRKFKAEVEASRRSAKDAPAPSITAIAESFLKSHLSPAMTSTTFPVARMSVDGVSPKTVVTQEASAVVSREQELKERLLRAKTRSDDTNHLTGDKRPASQSIQDSDSNKKPRVEGSLAVGINSADGPMLDHPKPISTPAGTYDPSRDPRRKESLPTRPALAQDDKTVGKLLRGEKEVEAAFNNQPSATNFVPERMQTSDLARLQSSLATRLGSIQQQNGPILGDRIRDQGYPVSTTAHDRPEWPLYGNSRDSMERSSNGYARRRSPSPRRGSPHFVRGVNPRDISPPRGPSYRGPDYGRGHDNSRRPSGDEYRRGSEPGREDTAIDRGYGRNDPSWNGTNDRYADSYNRPSNDYRPPMNQREPPREPYSRPPPPPSAPVADTLVDPSTVVETLQALKAQIAKLEQLVPATVVPVAPASMRESDRERYPPQSTGHRPSPPISHLPTVPPSEPAATRAYNGPGEYADRSGQRELPRRGNFITGLKASPPDPPPRRESLPPLPGSRLPERGYDDRRGGAGYDGRIPPSAPARDYDRRRESEGPNGSGYLDRYEDDHRGPRRDSVGEWGRGMERDEGSMRGGGGGSRRDRARGGRGGRGR